MTTEQELKGIKAHLDSIYLEMNALHLEMNAINARLQHLSEQPDYSHLLPEGYEFCEEEMAEQWIKVKTPTEANPLGHIWQLDKRPLLAVIGEYRPIRKIQTASYAVDWSQAPEWADVHCFDYKGVGKWGGFNKYGNYWWRAEAKSPFTLPDGLDWKLSKTFRPQ